MRYLLILFLSIITANAYCYYLPCDLNIKMAEQQTQMALEKEYLNTNQELQKTILEYKNKISKLKELKKELEIELKLTKEQLLKNQELIFIVKKYNKIKAINIDVKANE